MVWPVLTNDAYLKQVLPFLKELKKEIAAKSLQVN